MIGSSFVYVLCFLACAACAILLVRSWRRSRVRLLAWSAAGFTFLAVANSLLLIDMVVVPELDLAVLRYLATLAGVSTLLIGFVWESD